ncbi:MAG: carbohydrate binding family 9 domain-containing protein, partial [Fidelibacterota bacterium]
MKVIVVTVLLGLAATVSANPDVVSSEPAVAIERWDSTEPFNLDGLLDEDFWQSATNLSDFKQVSPFLGESPTEETEVLLSYDDDFLYIGARLYQSNPDEIFASVLERDQNLNADDFFEVIIDSYNDKTNALGFRTNLLGTRVDYEVSNNGVTINQAWNTFWDVRTTRTDSGWNAEFQIPLASLRYVPAMENTMGFKFIRRIKSKSEMLLFPMKDQTLTGLEYHLQNTAEIALTSLGKKRPLFITPYSAGSITQTANLNGDGTAYVSETQVYQGKDYIRRDWMDRLLSNNGFDIKYRLNNSHTLDLTVNTDFAQAEADDRIVNLTRYSVALPEKRAFFLENADLLSASMFHHVFFHSRNIGIESDEQVPLVAGARLTGTTGGFQYGLLNIQS